MSQLLADHAGARSSAWHLFTILLRARIRMLRNSFRSATPTHKLVISVLLGFGALVFTGIGVGCAGLALIMQGDAPPGAPLTLAASGLVSHVYQYLFFFLLAGSVPYVASSLFQDNDLPLLLTTPAPPASVVAAKMVDAVVANSSQFMVLGVPVLMGLWWGIRLSPAGWGWCAGALALLLLVTPLLSGCLLLILAKLFGMRRVRFVVMAVSIILALSITLIAVAGASRATAGGSMNYRNVRNVLLENAHSRSQEIKSAVAQSMNNVTADKGPQLTLARAGTVWLPSTWAAAVALDGASYRPVGKVGREGVGLLGGGVVVLFMLCVLIGNRVVASETILEQQDLESFAQRKSGRSLTIPGLSRCMAGLLLKDIRYVGRDTILIGQIGTTLILFLVPFVLKATQPPDPQTNFDTYGDLTKLMVVLIVFMVTSIIGLTSVGLEGKGVWMVLGSPMARRDFLRAKWILSFGLSFGIVIVLLSISGLVFRWSIFEFGQWIGLLACACYALTGLSVGLGGLFPRFLYDNPAHRASIWAMTLGFVFSSGYMVFSGCLFVVAWLAYGQGLSQANTVALVGVVLFVILTIATGSMPMRLAERRLLEYEWES